MPTSSDDDVQTTPVERCDRCGWPLVDDVSKGCTRDNCSQRPLPPKRLPPHCSEHNELLPCVGCEDVATAATRSLYERVIQTDPKLQQLIAARVDEVTVDTERDARIASRLRDEAVRAFMDDLSRGDDTSAAWDKMCLLFGRYCEPWLSVRPICENVRRDRDDPIE